MVGRAGLEPATPAFSVGPGKRLGSSDSRALGQSIREIGFSQALACALRASPLFVDLRHSSFRPGDRSPGRGRARAIAALLLRSRGPRDDARRGPPSMLQPLVASILFVAGLAANHLGARHRDPGQRDVRLLSYAAVRLPDRLRRGEVAALEPCRGRRDPKPGGLRASSSSEGSAPHLAHSPRAAPEMPSRAARRRPGLRVAVRPGCTRGRSGGPVRPDRGRPGRAGRRRVVDAGHRLADAEQVEAWLRGVRSVRDAVLASA